MRTIAPSTGTAAFKCWTWTVQKIEEMKGVERIISKVFIICISGVSFCTAPRFPSFPGCVLSSRNQAFLVKSPPLKDKKIGDWTFDAAY